MTDNNEQLIEDYLLNRLNPQERQSFERKISSDEALREELEFKKLVIKGSRSRGKDQMKNRLKKIHQKEVTAPVKTRRIWPVLTSVAAVIILLIIGGTLFFSQQNLSPNELYLKNYSAYAMSFGTRSEQVDLTIAQLNQLYKNQDYQKALPLFEELLQSDQQNARLLLGAGICHLELDQTQKAQSYFLKIIEAKDLRLMSTAQWYMALSHLKDGDIAKSKSQLKTMLNNSQTSNIQKAKELLKTLE